jgi:hypothetical protein
MWVAVCRNCLWASGEAYLRSVADYMATVHMEDHAGHKVVVRQPGNVQEGAKPGQEAKPRAG